MNNLNHNRLTNTFGELRASGAKTLLPFVTAGYPDLETTEAILHDFAARGVRICELGIPFSDPVADGAVIQASYTYALAGGVTSEKVFEMVRRFRAAEMRIHPDGARTALQNNSQFAIRNSRLALIAMVSYSIVFRHDPARYASDAAAAGFDGLIIPDLPLEETASMEQAAAKAGLAHILLVAPTTPPKRRYEIARASRGFVYFMSVAGITGERTKLPPETIRAVGELRRHTDTPVCAGFGISDPQSVAEVCKVADGAIVGSAIVRKITEAVERRASRKAIVRSAGEFVGQLLKGTK